MDLKNLIYRADELTLQELLGNGTLKILRAVDEKNKYNSELKAIVKKVLSDKSMLLNQKSRCILIDLLKINEAEQLALLLNINDTNNMYEKIKSKNFRRGSNEEKILFSFFDMPSPPIINDVNSPTYNDIEGSYPLFKHQRKAGHKINEILSNKPRRALLHMPTGSGKTRTAMNLVVDHLRNKEPSVVLWLAVTEELCEQAASEFEKAWGHLGNRSTSVTRLWGDSDVEISTINDGFIVAGLPKLYTLLKKEKGHIIFAELAKNISFIVFDEAHQAIANTYRQVVETLYNEEVKLLGLSATPGRTYNDVDADEELALFFSKNKVKLEVDGYSNPVDFLIDEGYLAKVKYKQLSYDGNYTLENQLINRRTSSDISKDILKKLGEDENRNLAIVMSAKELAQRHSRIILFAPSVSSSDSLSFVFNALGYMSYSLTGYTDTQERHEIISDFKNDDSTTKILCNYGVLTTGFDAPKTSAAVIARPTLSLVLYSQMVGRAIRGWKAGGNKESEVITVVDQNLPGFRSVAESFENWEDVWK